MIKKAVITLYKKNDFDEGDSISHVNDDELNIKSVDRSDILNSKSFFKLQNSTSRIDGKKTLNKAQSIPEEEQKIHFQARGQFIRDDIVSSEGNFKKRKIGVKDVIKEEAVATEELSQRQIGSDSIKARFERSTEEETIRIEEIRSK